ncbi:MAG: hypothetical protein ABSD27_06715 [Bryobacteraceae bacterium]|jgi:DNA-binding NarL/FixJ family response regulator
MSNELRLLLIEDDHLQAQGIQAGLRDQLARDYPSVAFDVVPTESEFYSRFEQIASAGFAAAIVDVMLRWADPSPQMPEPPTEVLEGGFFRAGLRCRGKLATDPRTSSLPVVIYTVLEESRLPAGIDIVVKSTDLSPLADRIRRQLAQRKSVQP